MISTRHSLVELWSSECGLVATSEFQPCAGNTTCQNSENDCLVTDWAQWGECSASCGGGIRTRTRSILRPPTGNGRICPRIRDEEDCGIGACPIDCKPGNWSLWSDCSALCGLGTKMRTRPILVPRNAHPHSKSCGPVTQVAPCLSPKGSCEVDCLTSDWTSWSSCDRPCGTGSKRRQKTVIQLPTGKGEPCPPLEEIADCNEKVPCPVDCLLSEWSEWNECSASCLSPNSDGFQTRARVVIRTSEHDGKTCDGNELIEERKCRAPDSCSKVDCLMGLWSECSASCGEGEMFKDPVPPIEDGISCKQTRQTAPCYSGPCPLDCQVSEWSVWEPCSAKCGGGEQRRNREIFIPAMNGGIVCPHLWDVQICNDEPCEQFGNEADCKLSDWSPWSPCSKESCGGGVTFRSRVLEKPPGPGGKPCGVLTETKGCNLQRCPGDKCEDNPRLESEQGISCAILKTQGCSSPLTELAKTHGMELPTDVPPEVRVQDVCPKTCGVCEGN